ncbi:ABC transporter ATP-binding protein [Dermatophilus congolensis]|uniref:Probable siderophore transport system ATP-binding protein YusV n=1 Tax=Dermatophilus congolensis TaxID=1863 RepID=A0A239V4C2_9MICO|nr:ABC transporter ATP-binding protein [Dermatophilus congolensis]MBO3130130.1 ABC transporter ATP-binding protein [Dermatophilus congolensis]MBO3131243.1 ABC transporter ATP-binding protein [Dermatophilus congolensis]MBO3134601.1 ABC transporter ATP-binding protein [Dermatophilus congolensis]MBO3136838.1 ABC transporter ATP-binding protein [Dermatophilus congolensis]MBO3139082.1 ABC transporter ATP-binding protein [Dermatophilus congolensis]
MTLTAVAQTVTPALRASGISVGYRGNTVVKDCDLEIRPGVMTAILGPNGCGKSTLLKSLARLIPTISGSIELNGQPLASLSGRELARRLAMLTQTPTAPEGIRVADLVALGRHPYRSWLRQWSSSDAEAVREAMALTGVSELADRRLDALSGGQRQRAWIAMVLAQQTDVLLLDEPTTSLDLARSLDLLDLVDRLHADHGRTVVMVLHDLALACRYCDDLVMMRDGRIITRGEPQEIVTEELLFEVFGLRSRVIEDPVSGRPLIVPVGERHSERIASI